MAKLISGLFNKYRLPYCAAVIVAAGSSSRMGGTDKIFADLAGKPVLAHTLGAFQQSDVIREIVVVTRPEMLEPAAKLCNAYGITKALMVVPGGTTRAESVQAGLLAVSKKAELIAIHDGARPLVSQKVIESAVHLAYRRHASEPGVPVKDTIKRVKDGAVAATPARAGLYAVQTPQVFDADLIRGAVQNALEKNLPITDDAMAVEALGVKVYVSAGNDNNLKITTPTDLLLAEAILRSGTEE